MTSDHRTVALDEVVAVIIDHRGRTPKKLGGDFTMDGVQVVSAKNVYGGRLHRHESQRFVSPEMAERWMPEKLAVGDVLVTSEAPLGEVSYLDAEPDLCLGQRLFALRGRPNLVDARFLYFAMLSPIVQARLKMRASGTTAQGIRQAELRQVELDLPTLSQQRLIASVLASLDDKLDSNRRLAALLEQLGQATFYRRFGTPRSWAAAAQDGESPPDGCRWGSFSEIADLKYGKSLPAGRRRQGSVAVVGSSGIVGEHDTAFVAGPGVVIGRKGTAGSVTWVPGDFWPIDTTFYATSKAGAGLAFVYYAARAADFVALTADSAVPGLNRDAALARPAAIPSQSLVDDFEQPSRRLREKQAGLEREGRTLTAIRDALLPKLVSGQIRVPDTADPEEVVGPAAEELVA